MTLCRWLRWKTLYGRETLTEAELSELVARNDVPYSCLKTCEAWGPDGDVAAPEACGGDRACFERSRRLIGPVA